MDRAGTWLVFADDTGFASVLIARLQSAGQEVVTVTAGGSYQRTASHAFVMDPANAHHHDMLIRDLQASKTPPDRIVHAWSVSGIRSTLPEDGSFARAQASGFYCLLFLARALAAHNVGHEIKLFVLSNNVQEIWGAETLCPEKSTLLGPCMVIGQEYPNIHVKSIDLELSGHAGEHESTADLVIGEFLDPDTSLFVAYRNAQRWAQIYEPVALDEPGRGGPSFRAGGVYLITGGLGKIGIAISEYLAEKYRASLVLVGRSTLPGKESWSTWIANHPADDPTHARIRAIERIENLGGDVLYVNASVEDASAMRRVFEQAYQRFGALHGVIHGAGIVGDGGYREIKDCDHANCDQHFQAKARGALVLEELLDGKALDFCLLLSSLTSVLGGIGQAAYASANLFLDSFARWHNRSSAVPWLSVNWDVWRLQDHAEMGSGLGTTLKELGMSAKEAMAVMETVLAARTTSQLIVSTGHLDARINQWIKLESLAAQKSAAASSTRSAPSPRPGLQTHYDAPRDETEQQVARVWQDALGIDPVGIHDGFAQLGGHSLLAVRIVAELRKVFQVALPVRALFDAPTVAELARYIKEQIVAEINALTDDEAQRLVSNG
jgi:NAD(P)-dependent dehydrogenase (short-subunit alcohol dehydrogenase family)/acyl carrier protein